MPIVVEPHEQPSGVLEVDLDRYTSTRRRMARYQAGSVAPSTQVHERRFVGARSRNCVRSSCLVQKGRRDDLKTEFPDLMSSIRNLYLYSDAVATRGRAQGQAVIEYLGKRPAMKNQSLVGSVTAASRFEDTRKNLAERLSTVVENVLKPDHDSMDEERLFHSLKQTAFLSASLQTGALCSAVSTYWQLLDPTTGLVALVAMAGGGGASYVMGTSRIAQQYQQQWQQRADRLEHALAAISEKELDRVNRRILDGVAPYTRYVESEQERLECLQEQCERIGSAARTLRNRISKL